jgi:hypothetical protein
MAWYTWGVLEQVRDFSEFQVPYQWISHKEDDRKDTLCYQTPDNIGSMLILNNILRGPGQISDPGLTINEGLIPPQSLKILK